MDAMVCVCAPSLKVSISAMKAIVAVTNSVLWKNTFFACGSPQAFITTMGRRSSSPISPNPSSVAVLKSSSKVRGNFFALEEKSWTSSLLSSSIRSVSLAVPYRVAQGILCRLRQRTSTLLMSPRMKLKPITVRLMTSSAKRNVKLLPHSG